MILLPLKLIVSLTGGMDLNSKMLVRNQGKIFARFLTSPSSQAQSMADEPAANPRQWHAALAVACQDPRPRPPSP